MIDKRLLKEVPGTKLHIMKQVTVQWSSLLRNVVFVALLTDVPSHVFHKTVNEQLLLLTTCGVVLYITLGATCVRKAGLYSHEASCRVREQLRIRLFKKLLEMKSGYTESAPTSELVQLGVEGIDQLEIYFGRYPPQFFYSMPAPVALFLVLVWMDVKSTFVLLSRIPFIPMSIIAVQKSARKLLSKHWSSYTTLGDSFLENLQDLATLKVYQADEWKQQEMNRKAENLHKITMEVLTMQLNPVSAMGLIAYGGTALDSIIAILGSQNGNLSLFRAICTALLSSEFFISLRLLGLFFHIAMNGIAAGDKTFRILDRPQKQAEQRQWKAKTMDIQLRDLSLSCDEQRAILKYVYMQLRPGQFTTIVGESGSGKSTIARLIVGIIKDYHRQLLIVDTQRRNIDDDAFYQSFLYVSYQPFIFKGNAREDPVIAKDSPSKEAVLGVLRKVTLFDLVMEQGGLDMRLQEQGNNLSGRQKQRLLITRALLAQRDVYIFDEAIGNIGAESEDVIIPIIHKLVETKTVIMTTCWLKGIKDCDQIYVIDQDICQEHRRHEGLLCLWGTYVGVYEKQQELEAMGGTEQYA